MPEIKLTPQESEKYFHSALCNGLGYVTSGYGLRLDYTKKAYNDAKKSLEEKIEKGEVPHFVYHPEYEKKEGKKPTICFEDVLIEILATGGALKMTDIEGEGANPREITIKEVHERVQKTDFDHLNDMINEQDDAVTADVIIQTVFLNEVIFG